MILMMLVLALAVGAIILFQVNMTNGVNAASERTIVSMLKDNANQVKYVLDNQIDNIWTRMEMVDASLNVVSDLSRDEAVQYMNGILPRAHNVELVTADGEYLNKEGKTGFVIADEDAFSLFLDYERICVLRQEGKQDAIMFGMPISPVKVEGKEYGFVLAYYSLDNLLEILSVESFAGEGKIRVLNENGFVIMSTDNIDRDKASYYFLRLYEDSHFIDNGTYSDYESFRLSVKNGENNAVHVAPPNAPDRVISYSKSDRLDWYIVIVVEYAAVLGGLEKQVKAISFTSISFIVLVVVLAFALIGWLAMDMRKTQREKNQLQELNTSLESARRVAEQALEIAENANQAKSYFLSNMSHDIRTPMNAIVGFTTLLAREPDNPEKVMEYTRKIHASSQHLLGLINDVLDMSKIESGKTTLNLSEETIGDIISDVDAIIRPQMNAKHHQFNIVVQDVVHEKILVDKTRLNQILMNLLSNAVKYTPDGGKVELRLTETVSTPNIARYRLEVSDNGYGMSRDFMDTIFDSFSREEDSRTSRIQGTGLGMAITKQMVDLMGGSISVASDKGVGTTFTVILQFQLGEEDHGTQFWEDNQISRCLVVDDEEAVCESIVLSMENTGVAVDYSLSGAEAVERARTSDPYQLVILDWKMPVMDGIETARGIRAILPEKTTIMLLTAFDFSDLETQALEGVVDGIISKPFFVNTLKRKIESIHEQRKAQDVAAAPPENVSVFQGMRVMIAEDNELNSEILNDLLESRGAICSLYENGKLASDAFEASEPGTFDLIFMDVQMPVMNGYEATRTIRACGHPDALSIPIIAMTANTFTEDIQNALNSGMNAHAGKPVDMNVLEATVRQVMKETGKMRKA